MVKTSPFGERSLVTRSVTFSTVPTHSVVDTTVNVTRSPKPYCFSTIIKNPARMSLTTCWAPKPRAAPMTVAGATRPATEKLRALAIRTMLQMAIRTIDTH